MAGISKRIFGSELPLTIKKKLEAYQNLQGGPKNPNDRISSDSDYTYNDLLSFNVNGELDLSSRTPFVRLWTAVEIQKHTATGVTYPIDSDIPKQSDKSKVFIKENGNIVEKKITKHEKIIYQLGNHTLNELSAIPNERIIGQAGSLDDAVGNTSGEKISSGFIPNVFETNQNEFMKPPAGITSISSATEGALGAIKRTTVNFVVHNFHDFDKIYSRYFLKPGAQVILDFGWDTTKLYDCITVIDETQRGNLNRGDTLDDVFFGDKGLVTDSSGDLEVLMGYVTKYDSKITTQGSVECSLEFVSKNDALVNHSYQENDKLRNRIIYNLDYEVLNFAAEHFDKDYLTKDPEASEGNDKEWLKLAERFAAANLRGTSTNVPTEKSLITGVYWQTIKSEGEEQVSNSKNIYVSFGFFEDKILNGEFGIGEGVENILYGEEGQVRFDSSNSFVRFDRNLLERQKHTLDATTLAFIYPQNWDKTYNTIRDKIPTIDEIDTSGVEATITDKKVNRIPIREIFISLNVIKEAFKNNSNVRSVLKTILDDINSDSVNVLNLQMSANNYAATELSITDRNYGGLSNSDKTDYFDEMFTFKPLSNNSIVQKYDIAFTTPKGGLQNMIAIQAMSPGQSLFADSEMIDKLLSLSAIDRTPTDANPQIGTVYLPEVGNYSAHRLENNSNLGSQIAFNFASEDKIFGNDRKKEQLLDSIAGEFEIANADFLKSSSEALEEDPAYELEDTRVADKNTTEEDEEENEGAKTAGSIAEFYEMKIKDGFYKENLSTILPVELTITIYGISSIVPGDIFKVDYLPKRYLQNVYFQVTKVAHDVNSGNWSTTLSTVMRLRKSVKNKIGRFGSNSGQYSSPQIFITTKALEEYGLTNYEDLAPLMKKLTLIPKAEIGAKTDWIDYIFRFEGRSDDEYSNTQWGNIDNQLAKDVYGYLDGNATTKAKGLRLNMDNSMGLGLFGADLEYEVDIVKDAPYYLLTQGDRIMVMPTSLGTTWVTNFNNFFSSYGLSELQKGDAAAGVQSVDIPDLCKVCRSANENSSIGQGAEDCVKAGGGRVYKERWKLRRTWEWKFCYWDTDGWNECIPNPAMCPPGDY